MRPTKIIAVANHKGGVGKTTSVASIGAGLAALGYRTLLVDLDTQANLTASLLEQEEQPRTIYEAITERALLPVVELGRNLHIVPSSLRLAGVELEQAATPNRETILRDLLKPHKGEYEAILLDCPPSMGLVTINAFAAADEVYIPLTAEALPLRGLCMMQDIVRMTKETLNAGLELSGIIITQWEGRKLNRMAERELRDLYKDMVFTTKIRKNIAVAEAPLVKKDIYAYSADSNGAKDYRELTKEVAAKLWQRNDTGNTGNADNTDNTDNTSNT